MRTARPLAPLAAVVLASAAATASAQAPTPPPVAPGAEAGSAVVAELEVIGRPPGPAVWRVRRGASEVLILGAVTPLPHSLKWDDARVRRAISGSRVVLEPPVATAGVLDAPSIAMDLVRAHAMKPLVQRTPPELYARVLAVARIAQVDPAKLSGWRAMPAGAILLQNFRVHAGLSTGKPMTTISRLAREAKAPVRNMLTVGAMPVVNAAVRSDDAHQLACLSAAMDDVQWEAGHARAAAEAWASGRLAELRANLPRQEFQRCVFQLPSGRALRARGAAESEAALKAELERPGKAFAVVDMTYLLSADGVLDRLRASGAEVTLPPG